MGHLMGMLNIEQFKAIVCKIRTEALIMFRSFFRYFKFINTIESQTYNVNRNGVGRWDLRNNSDITNIFANYDHCGASICKDPKEITKDVDDVCKPLMPQYLQQKNKL